MKAAIDYRVGRPAAVDGGSFEGRRRASARLPHGRQPDLHVGKILALRVDDVEMPGGGTAKREIVEHTGAVAVVAIDDPARSC